MNELEQLLKIAGINNAKIYEEDISEEELDDSDDTMEMEVNLSDDEKKAHGVTDKEVKGRDASGGLRGNWAAEGVYGRVLRWGRC